ncbi:MAG: hypothetical protein JXQ23_12150 [Clostridia bacterium]|nr:hypothetical protein [Clostridia bacterium]
MKKLITILLISLCISSLVACTGGSYLLVKGGFSSSDSRLEGQYSTFTGDYYRKVTLTEGDSLTFSFLQNTIEGSLTATVNDKNKNVVFDITDGAAFKVEKTGQYRITVHGEKHNGNFIITWDK